MGDLARALVQSGVLTPEAAARAQKAARNGDLASAVLDLRLADEGAVAQALAQLHECPGVDLSRSVIPTAYLATVAGDFCADHRALPLSIGRTELVLAMANPDDLNTADEVRFLTGKKVLRCVAVGAALHRALDGVLRARRDGLPAWRGERAPAATAGDPGAAHAAMVKPAEPPGSSGESTDGLPLELASIAEFIPMLDPAAGGPPTTPSARKAAAPPPAAPPPPAPYAQPSPYAAPPGGYAPQPYAHPAPPAPGGYAPQPYAPPGGYPGPYGPAPAPGYAPAPAGYAPQQGYAPQPYAQPAAAPQGHPTVRLEGMAVGRVAVVADDDEAVRNLVAAVLRKTGCLVLPVADGRAALDLIREARPDLAVLDAMMPGMHGFEVCRAIKGDRVLRATRVVLCSAIYRGTVGTDAQVAFGADAFVEKPFRIDELMRVFKVALVGPAAAESAQERASREEAQGLWRAAAEALNAAQVDRAAQLAQDATARDPWSAEAHYYLGHALARQNRLFEAVAAYERSAELRPDVDATHQCLAQLYERLGFQKSAREAWARAVETCQDPARRKVMQTRLLALLGV